MFRDYKQNNNIKIHSLITTSTFCIYQWDIMLPVNTVHVYMCTIVPTLNSIQSPCLHLAVIRVYHTEFLRLKQSQEKYIYTLSNSHFFFHSKILYMRQHSKICMQCKTFDQYTSLS